MIWERLKLVARVRGISMDVMEEMELKIDCDVLIYIHYFNKSTKMQLKYQCSSYGH